MTDMPDPSSFWEAVQATGGAGAVILGVLFLRAEYRLSQLQKATEARVDAMHKTNTELLERMLTAFKDYSDETNTALGRVNATLEVIQEATRHYRSVRRS